MQLNHPCIHASPLNEHKYSLHSLYIITYNVTLWIQLWALHCVQICSFCCPQYSLEIRPRAIQMFGLVESPWFPRNRDSSFWHHKVLYTSPARRSIHPIPIRPKSVINVLFYIRSDSWYEFLETLLTDKLHIEMLRRDEPLATKTLLLHSWVTVGSCKSGFPFLLHLIRHLKKLPLMKKMMLLNSGS